MNTRIKIGLTLACILISLYVNAQELNPYPRLKHAWDKPFASAAELTEAYRHIQSQIKKQGKIANTYNTCFFLLQSGRYILQCNGENRDISSLVNTIPLPALDHSDVISFTEQPGTEPALFTDCYYMIKALKKGETFNEARDGLSFSTQFAPRVLNRWDYMKLKDILSGRNETLQNIYLEKMKFLFRNNGCTDGMAALQPVIEKHIRESVLKKEILELYDRYEKIRPGQTAPTPVLKDHAGKEYSFNDFRGKVIVIDVWATWCCSCIDKMPSFLKLRDEFRGNDNIVFLSVSIDRKHAHSKWEKAVKDNHMQEMLNLIADSDDISPFETEYCIPSVPRYLVIDKKGKIVDAFAPSPGEELKQLILNTLK